MALDPITATIDAASTIIDKIFPDADAAQKRALALAMSQIDVNKAEASNPKTFVAGWRPFIGWVCGVAFAWQFVVGPVLKFSLAVLGHQVPLPILDTGPLITVLGGMLGLGSLRTFEKVKGVHNEH